MRRTVLVVSCMAVLVSGCTSSGSPKAHGSASPSSSSSKAAGTSAAPTVGPAWQSVLDEVSPDGSVGTAAALQAFALAFGPLPGVSVPVGDAGVLPDATGPMRWLVGSWADLTPAQRAAAVRLLPQPQPAAAASPKALGGTHALAVTDAAYETVKYDPQRTDFAYTQIATQAAADIGAKVGRPLGIPVSVHVNGLSEKYEAATGVYSASNGYTGTPTSCQIVLSVQGDSLLGPDVDLLLDHEVWHCFEATVIGLPSYWSSHFPQWLIEGEAEWVGTTLSPDAPEDSDSWPHYLSAPGKSVFARDYDAVGFWAQLAESGTDVWSHLIPALQAGGNQAGFVASGASGDDFLNAWGAGYFRDASRGAAWDITGAGVTSAKPTPVVLTASADHAAAATARAYAASIYSVATAGADVEHFVFSGHARVSDSAGHDYLVQGTMTACVKDGGCECPGGSAGPPLLALDAGSIALGVSGDPSGNSGTVTGESLKDYCNTCPTTGTAVPAGTYTGPIHAVLTVTLHVSGQLTADGSGNSTGDGTVTVVSDGKTVSGSMTVKASGTSKLSFDPIGIGEDSYFGGLKGTISGPASAPIITGTLDSIDAVAGPQHSPLHAGLHLTKIGCGSISGDLIAMFTEITQPVAQYVTVAGTGAWTATRQG